jgi:hypothetical protein
VSFGSIHYDHVDAEPTREPTYHGRPCKKCKGTLRYTSTRNCIPCQRKNVSRYHAEVRKPLRGRGNGRICNEPVAISLAAWHRHADLRNEVAKSDDRERAAPNGPT